MDQSQNEDISGVYSNYILDHIFDETNKDIYLKIESAFDTCFKLSKNNQFLEAETQLKIGEAYKASINPNLQPWVYSFLEQRVSYYYYKTGDFEKAIDISNQIITSSKALVASGFQFMFFSGIQQMLNISRIFFAKKHAPMALEYSLNSIQQILRQSSKWKPNLFIESSSFSEKELIFGIQYKMIFFIIVETYSRAIKALERDWYSFNSILKEFTVEMEKLDFEIPFANYSLKNFSTFLKIVIYFFENGAEIIDETGADFIQSKHTEKPLLKVLFDLAKVITLNRINVPKSETV